MAKYENAVSSLDQIVTEEAPIPPTEEFKAAFAEVYARLAPQLLHGLMNRGFPANIAADATQTGAVKVLQSHSSFKPEKGSLDAWYARIVHNAATDSTRRAERALTSSLDKQHEENGLDAPDLYANPEDAVLYLATQAEVATALASQPNIYRELLELLYVQGKSYDEIADLLNIEQKLVKSRLHHARKQLKLLHPELRHLLESI